MWGKNRAISRAGDKLSPCVPLLLSVTPANIHTCLSSNHSRLLTCVNLPTKAATQVNITLLHADTHMLQHHKHTNLGRSFFGSEKRNVDDGWTGKVKPIVPDRIEKKPKMLTRNQNSQWSNTRKRIIGRLHP